MWTEIEIGVVKLNKQKSRKKKKQNFFQKVYKYRVLLLMCMPAILFFFFFNYVPLPGAYIAFTDYNYRDGVFGSPFVGFKNFEFLFASGKLWTLTKNTILYNMCFIILGNILSIFMAVLLNEVRSKWFKKFSQTMILLPYFLSIVLVGLLAYNLFSTDYGFINGLFRWFGAEPYHFYENPNIWPIILIMVYLWQQTGYNSVVYFAAIAGIDAEIIEAARVDGANCFQKIRYIILPGLKPTVVILLLFAMGGIIRGNFGLFYNIIGSNSMLFSTTDIIETYVYRATMNDFNFQTASAVGLYQSVFGFIMVMVCNAVVKKIDPDYSLF